MKQALTILFVWLTLAVSPAYSQDDADGADAARLQDYQAALREWRPLAEQGDTRAQFNIASMYKDGLGVPRDYGKAINWYREAAENGERSASYNLGLMYYDGQGVSQDFAQATKWFQLAADQGHASAQINLGIMYATGRGVPLDFATSHMWFDLAAVQGRETAARFRKNVAVQMTPEQIAQAQSMARAWVAKHRN